MASNVETGGYQPDRYIARSWALLTSEKGWWKPVLICMAASFVPIVGPLAVLGYALEWSRRVAWGSTEGPSRHVKVGELIRSGWRGVVVAGGWTLASMVVSNILGNVPYMGELLDFVWSVFGILLGMVFMAAAVRATIYQDFKAGYRVKTLYQMTAEDPRGLLRVWLIQLAAYIVDFVASMAIIVPTIVSSLSWIVRLFEYVENYSSYYRYGVGDSYVLEIVAALIGRFGPAIVLAILVAIAVEVFSKLLMYAGLGLWMRRFDVDKWGKEEDPLPERAITAKAEASEAAAPVAPIEPEPVAPEPEAPEPIEPAEPAVHQAVAVEPVVVTADEPPVPGADEEPETPAEEEEEIVAVEPVAVALPAEPAPAASAADAQSPTETDTPSA
ncbi:DUF4013 domain-containing protein [Paratractidigestivibacter sp.]|uniref:DUF4013 domain-containing protein n=1 Tax=Paratractidigestivibacter sp. TaxID=2847316 RepID=UPI002ABD767E|nr:DUF4013 domain-containing protein [Paratractidigestivibacter sp.]